MIYADDFIDSLGSDSLKEYYFGNKSHGKYNDNTGKAYLLKYSKRIWLLRYPVISILCKTRKIA